MSSFPINDSVGGGGAQWLGASVQSWHSAAQSSSYSCYPNKTGRFFLVDLMTFFLKCIGYVASNRLSLIRRTEL